MSSATTPSAVAQLGRLFWMIIGPFAAAICAIRITGEPRGLLGPLDIVYLVLVFGMILGRGLEFRYGLPMTATGGPATPAHLRRYTVAIITLGLGIWIMAKLIADLPTRSLG